MIDPFTIIEVVFVCCGVYLLVNCIIVHREVREPTLRVFIRPAVVWTAVAAIPIIAVGLLFRLVLAPFVAGTGSEWTGNHPIVFMVTVWFSVMAFAFSVAFLTGVVGYRGFGFFFYGPLRSLFGRERAMARIAQDASDFSNTTSVASRWFFRFIVAVGTLVFAGNLAMIFYLVWFASSMSQEY